jgi:hypothetical protein
MGRSPTHVEEFRDWQRSRRYLPLAVAGRRPAAAAGVRADGDRAACRFRRGTPTVHRDPTMTATLGLPTATPTLTPTASPSATATPTLERPSDPIALVIYGVVVNQAHLWLRSHVSLASSRRCDACTRVPSRTDRVRDLKPTAQAGQ